MRISTQRRAKTSWLSGRGVSEGEGGRGGVGDTCRAGRREGESGGVLGGGGGVEAVGTYCHGCGMQEPTSEPRQCRRHDSIK